MTVSVTVADAPTAKSPKSPRIGLPFVLRLPRVVAADFSESYYAYVGAEYMESHKASFTRGIMAGGGYRPIENVVVKLQYLHIANEFQDLSSFLSNRVQVGVSVMF